MLSPNPEPEPNGLKPVGAVNPLPIIIVPPVILLTPPAIIEIEVLLLVEAAGSLISIEPPVIENVVKL